MPDRCGQLAGVGRPSRVVVGNHGSRARSARARRLSLPSARLGLMRLTGFSSGGHGWLVMEKVE